MNIQTPVKNIMTETVISVGPKDNLKDVQKVFADNSFHHLPVVDKNGTVVGILSRTDYQKVREVFSILKDVGVEMASINFAQTLLVDDIMKKSVVTIDANKTIEYAFAIFKMNFFHAMPVIDEDNKLVGIFSTYDLLCAAYNQ